MTHRIRHKLRERTEVRLWRVEHSEVEGRRRV